jgi:hypothetical protein
MRGHPFVLSLIVAAAASVCSGQLGEEGTPMLPGLPWHVHDATRPHPAVVTPGAEAGRPPSDAIVLFDGKDLSKWMNRLRGKDVEPKWRLGDGYVEVVDGAGDLVSKEKFGDAQIHVEWASPAVVTGSSQGRGNSGVLIMERYEIQVLDCSNNPTYADGQTGAIYGQWPPLVNPCRKPGEWQTYDIFWEAPRFQDGKLVKPAFVTVMFNGVLIHHHKELMGRMIYRQVGTYAPHAPQESLMLQDHHNPVRYRNIWVRRLGGYDTP